MDAHADQIGVTVIVPTLAEAQRAVGLRRAIATALASTGVSVSVIVVVNGSRFSGELLEELRGRADISVIQIPEASLAAACREGRKVVQTPLFAFLDDDDELIQDGLRVRRDTLLENPQCVASVCAGYREVGGELLPCVENLVDAARDPFGSLATGNWLASCGGLYRTASVPPEVFDGVPRYYEWTFVAYRILCIGRLSFVFAPAYVIHDTPGSESKSREYFRSQRGALLRILELNLPPRAKRGVLQRLGRAEHDLADAALQSGRWLEAIRFHLRSLTRPAGLRYLTATRHFLRKAP